jgi:hypothetical protein
VQTERPRVGDLDLRELRVLGIQQTFHSPLDNERRPGPHPLSTRQKREGDFSCETSPSLFRFSKIRFGTRSQRLSSGITRHPRATPAVSAFFPDHTHCKSFSLPSVSSCLDRVSLPILGDNRYSTFSFWKITLPLKAILLFANANARGVSNLLLWKWRDEKWKSGTGTSSALHGSLSLPIALVPLVRVAREIRSQRPAARCV